MENIKRTLGINYPVLVIEPADAAMMARWGNRRQTVPYSVVITPDGRVAFSQHGLLDREVFEEKVLPLLGSVF